MPPGNVRMEQSNKNRGAVRRMVRQMKRNRAKDSGQTLEEMARHAPMEPSEKALKRPYYMTGPGSRRRPLTPTGEVSPVPPSVFERPEEAKKPRRLGFEPRRWLDRLRRRGKEPL